MNLKEKARNLKMNIQVIFVAFQKKETPWYAKVMAAITIGYALSPIDFIPDFIPVLGYLDDLILLPLLIMISIRLIPKDVMEQSRQEAQHLWENGKPKKWYYSVPIILIWILIVFLAFKLFFI